MDIYACVITRPLASGGIRVVIYIVAVLAVIAVLLAGYSLPEAILAAAGAGWAAAGTGRRAPHARALRDPR